MRKVQFLKGRSKDLSKVPLTEGAIYFTTDEHRLYIDTAVSRLPVVTEAGKVLYVTLPSYQEWINYKCAVTVYADSKTEVPKFPISSILTEDSILFVGNTNGDANIICTGYKIISFDETTGTSTFGLEFKYVGNAFEADINSSKIIQIYSPNPAVKVWDDLTYERSVYIDRITLKSDNWEYAAGSAEMTQTVYINDINLTAEDDEFRPFFITLADDSIENQDDFSNIKTVNVTYDAKEKRSEITFVANLDENRHNIGIMICIVIAPKITTNIIEGYPEHSWDIITLQSGTVINNGSYFLAKNTAPMPVGEDVQELLVYPIGAYNTNIYNQIQSINYIRNAQDTGGYEIIFYSSDSIELKNSLELCVINLNALGDVYDYSLKSEAWVKVTTKDSLGEENEKVYYCQAVRLPEGKRLKEKYPPLVYSKTGTSQDENTQYKINQIIETFVQNGILYIYAKNKPMDEIDIKIVDFK